MNVHTNNLLLLLTLVRVEGLPGSRLAHSRYDPGAPARPMRRV
jgi:hypothetical protein